MIALMDIARTKGLKIMEGEVLTNNSNMMKLMERLEFTVEPHPEDGNLILVRKVL
jgi:acetyltransferase